jgi:acetolactate synthase-1/2/3 large subunit
MLDSVPIICVTGQVVSNLLGSDAFQETDVMGITIPITKWNYQITEAEEIPEIFAKAFYIATMGRPGPVVIDVTKDAQLGKLHYHYQRVTSLETCKVHRVPDPDAVNEAAALINEAKRPFMFIGQGYQGGQAEPSSRPSSRKRGCPRPRRCTGCPRAQHPPALCRHAGDARELRSQHASNKADLVLAVGMRFDDRVTKNLSGYLADAKIVHIDIDPAEIDKNVKTDVAMVADAKEALTALIPLIERRTHDAWVAEFRELNRIEHEKIIEKGIAPDSEKLRMMEVVNRLSQKTKDRP